MRSFPDVLGMKLSVAAALLEAEGFPFLVEEVRGTKGEVVEGTLRVIRVLPADEKAEAAATLILTVCKV